MSSGFGDDTEEITTSKPIDELDDNFDFVDHGKLNEWHILILFSPSITRAVFVCSGMGLSSLLGKTEIT